MLAIQFGREPFVRGLSSTDPAALLAAVVISALTTACCAWRWRLVAGALGLDVPIGAAVASCYRSQFVNLTLPGGVLGDVHRAVHSGRQTGQLPTAVRSVGWERGLGQAVQMLLTAVVVMTIPSAIRPPWPVVVGVVALGAVAVAIGAAGSTRYATILVQDLRDISHGRRLLLGVVLASAVAVVGHVTLFLVAIRTVGTDVSVVAALPLASVALLVAAVPVHVAGWGPREGAAAGVFGAAGLGGADGVAVSVVYGVMALVAALPGALLLAMMSRGRHHPSGASRSTRAEVSDG